MKVSDEKVIIAVLSNPTIAKAAKSLQISERALYVRLGKSELRQKLQQARGRLLESALTALEALTGEAIEIMGRIMRDPANSPQVRLSACNGVLTNTLKLSEQVDVTQRLEALEAALQEGGNR